MELIIPFASAFMYGFVSDFADLLDEHGLRWFKGADIIGGVIWGIAGSLLFLSYPPMLYYVVGTLLFWLVTNKLDYLNHQLAAVIILLATVWMTNLMRIDVGILAVSFAIITGLSLFAKSIKKKHRNYRVLSLRHYVLPFLLSLLVGNLLPTVLHIVIMIGVILSTKWFEAFEKNPQNKFGLSLK